MDIVDFIRSNSNITDKQALILLLFSAQYTITKVMYPEGILITYDNYITLIGTTSIGKYNTITGEMTSTPFSFLFPGNKI